MQVFEHLRGYNTCYNQVESTDINPKEMVKWNRCVVGEFTTEFDNIKKLSKSTITNTSEFSKDEPKLHIGKYVYDWLQALTFFTKYFRDMQYIISLQALGVVIYVRGFDRN